MTTEELEADPQSKVPPARAPSPVQPAGALLLDGVERAARVYADKEGLFDEAGQFYCRGCQSPTDWHVSLCCPPCRVELKRQGRERERQEREARRHQPVEPVQQGRERRVFR